MTEKSPIPNIEAQEPQINQSRRLLRWAFMQLALGLTGTKFEVEGQIPDEQFISAIGPHTTQMDNIYYLKSLQKQGVRLENVGMLAKKSYWEGWRKGIAEFMLGQMYMVETSQVTSLRAILRAIENNPSLIIGLYVQYGRDATKQRPIEPGFSFLAALADLPIVPVAILGTDGILPPGVFWQSLPEGILRSLTLQRQPVTVRFLDPIYPEKGKRQACMDKVEQAYRQQMRAQYPAGEVPPFLLD